MGIRTQPVRLQFQLHDGQVREVHERRRWGLRRWVGPPRIYRVHLDPITRYQRRTDFISRYHLTPECVLWLAETFAWHPACTTQGDAHGHGIPILQKVCLALRHMASGGTYGIVKDSQGGCSTSTVHRCVKELVTFFCCTARNYIKFPKKRDLPRVAEKFRHKFGINDVVGLVDGTYMPIIRPHRAEWAYVCRKKYHALNVMIVCDSDGRITYIDASFAGAQHDQTVWDLSVLGSKIDHCNRLNGYHLLGDAGYTLTPQMMTPYYGGDYQGLTGPEKYFHNKVVKVRSYVERVIGRVKGTWRVLSRFGSGAIKSKSAQAGRLVFTCACLHNIALDWEIPEIDAKEHDPDFGDVIASTAARTRQAAEDAVAPGHPIPTQAGPTMYASGAAKRAVIIHCDFGGPNPADGQNRARAIRSARMNRTT